MSKGPDTTSSDPASQRMTSAMDSSAPAPGSPGPADAYPAREGGADRPVALVEPHPLTRDVITGLSDPDRRAVFEQLFALVTRTQHELADHKTRIDQLEELSTLDELTGIANARGLHEFLRRTLAAADRHGEGGVLVYLDVDDLKVVNDRFGHDAGDTVLRRVAEVLAAHTRASDFVARLHGDEFAIVLTRTDPEHAAELVPAIQRRIGSASILHGGQAIEVRVSAGLASYAARADAADLLRRADLAMYLQKRIRKSGARPLHSLR